MHSLFSRRSLLWPALAATAFASFFVITQPGQIYADGAEYDAIARSILHGQFQLAETTAPGVPLPTMHREPGYPFFRAIVYGIVGDHPEAILWVQALLSGLVVVLTGLTIRRLDPRWELLTTWLLALFPGFAVWAGQHYSEMLAAVLVSVAVYAWVRMWDAGDDRTPLALRYAAAAGVAIGVLTLTKASFELLPVFAIAYVLIAGSWRFRWKQSLLVLAGFLVVVTPWMIRNKVQFDEFAITYRTGAVIYTRALKAQASWGQLATSYGSILLGESTMLHAFPETPPIIVQNWKQTWADLDVLRHDGLRFYQADHLLLQRGAKAIFSSPSIFARYIFWSGVDELRFFALTSPLSPEFGVELIANDAARAGRTSSVQWGTIIVAQTLQFVWWAFLLVGFVTLIRTRRWRHPSVLFVGYAAIMYAPFDDIPRYAVPLLPLIIALVVVAFFRTSANLITKRP